MPYHALYAVWKDVFYVVHGNDNSVEVIDVVANRAETLSDRRHTFTKDYDTAEDKYTNFYYGGYTVLAGAQTDEDPEGFTLKKGGTEATYAGLTWTRAKAAKNGIGFDGGVGDVYYIKEVPKDYLAAPKIATVREDYGNGDLSSVTVISVADTSIYRAGGITNKKGTFAASFTMNQQNTGAAAVTKTAKDLFGIDGMLIVYNWGTTEGTFTLTPYWTTYDSVTVESNTARKVTITKTGVADAE